MIKKIGIIFNKENKKAVAAAAQVTALLRKNGVEALKEKNAGRSQFVIALGGDGTLLRAAKVIKPGIPVLPVSLGSLGFLSGADMGGLKKGLKKLLAGKFRIEERMMLEAKAGGSTHKALNEFVIERRTQRAVVLKVSINSAYFATYLCDGIIASTPTGSTAYSLAAGGPVMSPALEGFIVSPVAPHTIASRTVILSGNESVTVEPGSGCFLTIDGQKKIPVQPGAKIRIGKSAEPFLLARLKEKKDFYVSVNRKLGNALTWRQ